MFSPFYSGDDAEEIMAEEQEAIDDALPLSEEEKEERYRLLEQGFDWTKKDFATFISAMETFGRNDLDSITVSIPGKEPEEVRRYHKVFWKRGKELPNFDKLVALIDKGEQRIRRKVDIQAALDEKIGGYRLPFIQLKFQYGTNKGKSFTEDEDRYRSVKKTRAGQWRRRGPVSEEDEGRSVKKTGAGQWRIRGPVSEEDEGRSIKKTRAGQWRRRGPVSEEDEGRSAKKTRAGQWRRRGPVSEEDEGRSAKKTRAGREFSEEDEGRSVKKTRAGQWRRRGPVSEEYEGRSVKKTRANQWRRRADQRRRPGPITQFWSQWRRRGPVKNFCHRKLYYPVMLTHFSPALVKTDWSSFQKLTFFLPFGLGSNGLKKDWTPPPLHWAP